jgi:polyphosphate kinase
MSKQDYSNRELSWLDFNGRVLQEAKDKNNPLLERFKFLGIFSNNRDEFFRVRVATLNRMRRHKKINPQEKKALTKTILEIQAKVAEQEDEYTMVYHSLIAEAKENSIFLINEKELNKEQQLFVKEYFKSTVREHIFPLILGNSLRYKNFKDKSVYLAVEMIDSLKKQKPRYALLEIPTSILPRFVSLPNHAGENYLMFLEDIVRFNLHEIFAILGYDIFNAYLIKFTRDAELDIDNDVLKSFAEIISESLKKRKKGPTVRFVYDREISPPLLKIVLHTLGIKSDDKLRGGGRYHNMKDFMNFPVKNQRLEYEELTPILHPDLPAHKSKFSIIKEKDVLLHFPYHSFKSMTDLVWEASIDPKVRAIKMTFYRVSRQSNMMKALINAARNGVKVTVYMELQARFDEEDNIYWTEKLQDEGVRIIPNIAGFKVHSKLILIRRKERGKNVFYANISTGNYHEASARVYSDTSLLTSDVAICNDVNNVFYLFETKYQHPKFQYLKVSPLGSRQFLREKIDREIINVKSNIPSYITIKANNLVDVDIINKLYEAADAGVKISLIIRGICVLKKDNPHPNIDAFGIVDRYLEHGRIFIFGNAGHPEYYISSADIMHRNLDHRIEVICPIKDKSLQQELQDIIDIQKKDNVKARHLQAGQINEYKADQTSPKFQSQIETYQYLLAKIQR